MFAYVGGYTTPDRNGRGTGITVYDVDPVSGGWTLLQTDDGLENPKTRLIAPWIRPNVSW
jgi:6-phosphogluconolactonase